MPYETQVYHPLSVAAPPCALREPLRKPDAKDNSCSNQFRSENLGKKPTKTKTYYRMFFWRSNCDQKTATYVPNLTRYYRV